MTKDQLLNPSKYETVTGSAKLDLTLTFVLTIGMGLMIGWAF